MNKRIAVLGLLLACATCGGLPGCAAPRPAGPALATAAPAPPPEGLGSCCQQCLDASSRDPAGMDLRPLGCARYRVAGAGSGVDERCAALLERGGVTVGQCQERAR